MRMTILKGVATAVAVLVAPGLPAIAQDRAPLEPRAEVRLGVIGAIFDAGALIAYEKGYFDAEGLDVELKKFGSSADVNQALAIGAIDVLAGGVSSALFNSTLRDIRMSVVAGAGTNTAGHGMISLILRKDIVDSGRYKTIADIKGMRLATGVTSPSHWMTDSAATAAGVGADEVEYVALGLSNILAAMGNGSIEGGSVSEPYATLLLEKSGGARVASMDELHPGFPVAYLLYGDMLTEKNPEAGTRFMVGYLRGWRDYMKAFEGDGTERDDVRAMLSKNGLEIGAQMPTVHFPEDGRPSLDGIADYLTWQLEKGFVREPVDIKKLVDDRFRAEALELLGAE